MFLVLVNKYFYIPFIRKLSSDTTKVAADKIGGAKVIDNFRLPNTFYKKTATM
jgi:hypothetical protein